MLPAARAFTYQVPLIPKLRGYFAEFLHHDSLDRLGILYLSTCVGLGYGRLTTRSRRFSRQHRITHFLSPSCLRLHEVRICLHLTLRTWPGIPLPGLGYLPASLRSLPNTSLGRGLRTAWTEVLPAPCALSITRLGRVVVSPVREYQPVVHRLRLSASP